MIRIRKDLVIDDRDIKERFVRASGAGDQNVNKEATAVELRMNIGASALPPDVKDRLIALAGRAVTTDGELVVVSRAYRSQARNREAARARLVSILQRAAKAPETRKRTRPRASVRERRHLLALEQAGDKPESLVHDMTLLPRHAPSWWGQSVTHPLGICCYLTLRKDIGLISNTPFWPLSLCGNTVGTSVPTEH